MTKITLKKGKNITKTNIKKLLKDEKIGLSCMTHIFQPRFSKTGYDKKSFQVKLGCSDMYTITNENIEWV